MKEIIITSIMLLSANAGERIDLSKEHFGGSWVEYGAETPGDRWPPNTDWSQDDFVNQENKNREFDLKIQCQSLTVVNIKASRNGFVKFIPVNNEKPVVKHRFKLILPEKTLINFQHETMTQKCSVSIIEIIVEENP